MGLFHCSSSQFTSAKPNPVSPSQIAFCLRDRAACIWQPGALHPPSCAVSPTKCCQEFVEPRVCCSPCSSWLCLLTTDVLHSWPADLFFCVMLLSVSCPTYLKALNKCVFFCLQLRAEHTLRALSKYLLVNSYCLSLGLNQHLEILLKSNPVIRFFCEENIIFLWMIFFICQIC